MCILRMAKARRMQDLFTDILSNGLTEVTWQLNLQTGSDSNMIKLEWNLDIDHAEGALTISNPDNTFQIDMFGEDSLEVDASEIEYLIIRYLFDI